MQTIPDSETPIFQELNAELGELPEINIHDFEEHSFGFAQDGAEAGSARDETASEEDSAEATPSETSSAHAATSASEDATGSTSTATKNAAGLAPVADMGTDEDDTETAADSATDTSAARKGGRRRKAD